MRELAMSYFHEYFLDNGKKTFRRYSTKPLDLQEFEDNWLTAKHNLWGIEDELINAPHENILSKESEKHLRRADPIKIRAGKFTEWKKR